MKWYKRGMSLNDVIGLPQFEAEQILKEGDEVFIHGKLQNTDKTCPSCGSEALKPHQYYQKKVRHLPFGNLPTYLVFERKDWICGCGKVFLERLDFQELYAHYTVQYADYVYELAKRQDLKRVAELENLSWDLAESLFLKGQQKKAGSPESKGVPWEERVPCG